MQLFVVKNDANFGDIKIHQLFSQTDVCKICNNKLDNIKTNIRRAGYCPKCKDIRYINTWTGRDFTRVIGEVNVKVGSIKHTKLIGCMFDRNTGYLNLYLTMPVAKFKNPGLRIFDIGIQTVQTTESFSNNEKFELKYNTIDLDNFNVFLIRNGKAVDSLFVNKIPYVETLEDVSEFITVINTDIKNNKGSNWFKILSKKTESLKPKLKAISEYKNTNKATVSNSAVYYGRNIYGVDHDMFSCKYNGPIETKKTKKDSIINNLILLCIIKPESRITLNHINNKEF